MAEDVTTWEEVVFHRLGWYPRSLARMPEDVFMAADPEGRRTLLPQLEDQAWAVLLRTVQWMEMEGRSACEEMADLFSSLLETTATSFRCGLSDASSR